MPPGVDLRDAVALGIGDGVGEYRRARRLVACARELALQVGAVEDVVAQHERRRRTRQELAADDERLREPVRRRLYRVRKRQSPLRTVAQQLREARRVLGRGNEKDVADARQHQRRQRIVDHRLVVHRQQLLGDDLRHRIEPRARSAREDDALTIHTAAYCSDTHSWYAPLVTASSHAPLSRYQPIVRRMPDSNVSAGAQPRSPRMRDGSIA